MRFSVHRSLRSITITGEAGIWYLSGHVKATFDAAGNMTSIGADGQLVDLCRQLAA